MKVTKSLSPKNTNLNMFWWNIMDTKFTYEEEAFLIINSQKLKNCYIKTFEVNWLPESSSTKIRVTIETKTEKNEMILFELFCSKANIDKWKLKALSFYEKEIENYDPLSYNIFDLFSSSLIDSKFKINQKIRIEKETFWFELKNNSKTKEKKIKIPKGSEWYVFEFWEERKTMYLFFEDNVNSLVIVNKKFSDNFCKII